MYIVSGTGTLAKRTSFRNPLNIGNRNLTGTLIKINLKTGTETFT